MGMAKGYGFKCGKATVLNRRAIQDGHGNDPGTEYRLQGKHGWVRPLPTGRLYVALDFTGATRLAKAAVGYQRPAAMRRGEEHFTYLGQEFAGVAFQAIGLYNTRPKQTAVANAWARKKSN